MNSKDWFDKYNTVKESIEELNANCCRDDNRIVCTMCKYSKECKIISVARGLFLI